MGKYQLRLALMQPTFNPWLGYFDLIDYVDTFVFLDTVQLNQQSWQTRNKLKVQNKEFLFSLPVQKNKLKDELFINEAVLDFRKFDFRKKLFRTLEQNYRKSKYFSEVNPFIKAIVFFESDLLSVYNINMIVQISKKLKIDTNILVLSEENYLKSVAKGKLVLDICQYFKTTQYVSPIGAKEYLVDVADEFIENNINIIYQDYNHPIYCQLGEEFIPYIGIFDLLYNHGFDESLNIIRKGRKYENR